MFLCHLYGGNVLLSLEDLFWRICYIFCGTVLLILENTILFYFHFYSVTVLLLLKDVAPSILLKQIFKKSTWVECRHIWRQLPLTTHIKHTYTLFSVLISGRLGLKMRGHFDALIIILLIKAMSKWFKRYLHVCSRKKVKQICSF